MPTPAGSGPMKALAPATRAEQTTVDFMVSSLRLSGVALNCGAAPGLAYVSAVLVLVLSRTTRFCFEATAE